MLQPVAVKPLARHHGGANWHYSQEEYALLALEFRNQTQNSKHHSAKTTEAESFGDFSRSLSKCVRNRINIVVLFQQFAFAHLLKEHPV
eukprot:4849108-Amphidinium_carterae.1